MFYHKDSLLHYIVDEKPLIVVIRVDLNHDFDKPTVQLLESCWVRSIHQSRILNGQETGDYYSFITE